MQLVSGERSPIVDAVEETHIVTAAVTIATSSVTIRVSDAQCLRLKSPFYRLKQAISYSYSF